METIPEILCDGVRSYGDQVAFRRPGQSQADSHSYRRVGLLAGAMAAGLAERGVRKGAPVALLCENRPEWAVAYFAIHLAGGICVPIDTGLARGEIRTILDRCGARLLIGSAGLLPVARAACNESAADVTVAALEELLGQVAAPERSDALGPAGAKVAADDVAVISFTSGTTGRSKAVVLTHRNIASNAVAGARQMGVLAGDRMLSILPLHHLFEQTGGMLAPFASGANVTYPGSLNPRTIIHAMQESQTTIMLLVPAMVRLFQKRILSAVASARPARRLLFAAGLRAARIAHRVKLPAGKLLFSRVRGAFGGKVRFFVSGGAALDPELADFFRDLGLPILQGYGLSEAGPIVACNTVGRNVVGSVGRPLPGVEVEIAPADGCDDGAGEILVRGPNVTAGYFQDPEATAEVIRDGWLRTGDLGRLDERGYLYVVGRAKDVIVGESGKNIYPDQIEAQISRSPYVREVCVLGVQSADSSGYAEEVAALIVAETELLDAQAGDGEQLLRAELQAACKPLASYKRPKYFAVWPGEFPRTATLKLKKHEIRNGLADVRLRPL